MFHFSCVCMSVRERARARSRLRFVRFLCHRVSLLPPHLGRRMMTMMFVFCLLSSSSFYLNFISFSFECVLFVFIFFFFLPVSVRVRLNSICLFFCVFLTHSYRNVQKNPGCPYILCCLLPPVVGKWSDALNNADRLRMMGNFY